MVLLSGGVDSSTALAMARQDGFACHCLSFDYGQRHRFELEAAARVARVLGAAEQRVYRLDLSLFSGSALTGPVDVPKDRAGGEMQTGIPVTYVPARNMIFLAIAVGWAETLGARDIFIGVNAVDYSGYPDCRPEFIAAFEQAANLATKVGVEAAQAGDGAPIHVHTPLVDMRKAEIIRTGMGLGVDFALTHSCYDPSPDGHACGHCDSCHLRRRGFVEAGVVDPTRYAEAMGDAT